MSAAKPEDFLTGLTCPWNCVSMKRTYNGGRYWLMKHAGHTAYVDRVTGSSYCATAWYLYDSKLATRYNMAYALCVYDDPAVIWKADGRFLKKYNPEIANAIELRESLQSE